jgi:predicted nucleic acid-binding protein
LRYLIDTNVILEVRKKNRADEAVVSWFSNLDESQIYLSVLTLGEIRRGVENVSRRDPESGSSLNRWLSRISMGFEDRIIPVDVAIAEEWGRMNVPDPLPVIDGLLAATAKIRGLTLATRNTSDIARTGVAFVNPFN